MQSEPVVINGILSIVAGFATPYLIRLGFTADGAAQIFAALGAIATAVLSAYGIARARSKVTPIITPAPVVDPTSTPPVPDGPPTGS